jgi:prepilin-type N-terminal cleavage/methylation domain-containing protein
MNSFWTGKARRRRISSGFTLTEVVVSLAISLVTITSITSAYITMAKRSEWSGCMAAANSALASRMEQVRAARWDPRASPAIDELVSANFPQTVKALDVPLTQDKPTYVTNTTTIHLIRSSPPLRMIRVDCTWQFSGGKVYTNSLVAYRSPDP